MQRYGNILAPWAAVMATCHFSWQRHNRKAASATRSKKQRSYGNKSAIMATLWQHYGNMEKLYISTLYSTMLPLLP